VNDINYCNFTVQTGSVIVKYDLGIVQNQWFPTKYDLDQLYAIIYINIIVKLVFWSIFSFILRQSHIFSLLITSSRTMKELIKSRDISARANIILGFGIILC